MKNEFNKKLSANLIKENRSRLRTIYKLQGALHLQRRGHPYPYFSTHVIATFAIVGVLFFVVENPVWLILIGAALSAGLFFPNKYFNWPDYYYRILTEYNPSDVFAFVELREKIIKNGINPVDLEHWISVEANHVREILSAEKARFSAHVQRSEDREKFLTESLNHIDRLKAPFSRKD
ncbi:hypothetical protein IIF17_004305 [Salmonella enterica]|jgi:hypothetical protein|nr:hypothetical protein [Salmonella enterica]